MRYDVAVLIKAFRNGTDNFIVWDRVLYSYGVGIGLWIGNGGRSGFLNLGWSGSLGIIGFLKKGFGLWD